MSIDSLSSLFNTATTSQPKVYSAAELAAKGKEEGAAATDSFMVEAHKSYAERLREQIMKQLGISEEELKNMPPKEQKAMQDKITQLVKDKLMEESKKTTGNFVDMAV